jgi:hypothetical protein
VLHWAAVNGLTEVSTWTQRDNHAMRRLNETLGYTYGQQTITVTRRASRKADGLIYRPTRTPSACQRRLSSRCSLTQSTGHMRTSQAMLRRTGRWSPAADCASRT